MDSISFAASPYAPIALGFFGLGTGYLILGPQELFGWPSGDKSLARSNGAGAFSCPACVRRWSGSICSSG
ncbi:hypothetical protein [Salinisphaera hydrothermalis]|uniref:hypothetical protein n=1 Tax=Salinisphaera hydrothermalis TaxID=563188 RepID=UPI00333EC54A